MATRIRQSVSKLIGTPNSFETDCSYKFSLSTDNTLDRTISPIKIEAIFSLRNFTSGAPKSLNQYGRGIEKIVLQLFPCTVPKIFEAVTDYLNDVGKSACLFMD